MANREARLILRLVDGVTGPARAIERSLRGVDRAVSAVTGGVIGAGRGVLAPGRAVTEAGRRMRSAAASSGGLSAPIGIGAYAAARNVYDYEKQGNTMEAVGQLTEAQREQLEQYGKELNTNFPFINKQILEAASELGKAGMNFDQIMGSLRSTLETALAGDIDLGESADIMTNVAQAMRLPMETAEQAAETMVRVSDTLAHAAVSSNTDIKEMSVVFRYVAPLAAAVGMSLEEMSVFAMQLANNGIKASNAGTGLRFALMRMLNMPKGGLAALERLNINLADFIKGAQQIDAAGVVSMLQLDGIDATGLESQINSILQDPALAKSPAKLVKALSAMMTDQLGEQGIVDAKVLSDSLSEILTVLGTEVDLQGFLRAIGDRPEGEALMGQIFGARHAPKMLSLLAMDMEGELQEFMDRYEGAARRMSEIRIKGVVGDVLRLQAALDNLTLTLSDSGVLESARKAIVGISDAINQLGQTNPELLEWGTYAVLALGAIAPLAWGMAGLAGALGLVANPLTWVAGGLAYLAYLNFDNIVEYVRSFGSAVEEGMGPRTQNAIGRVRDLMDQVFRTHDFDANSTGAQHGSWFAAFIENEIVAIEQTYQSFVDAWERYKGYWNSFEAWWKTTKATFASNWDSSVAAINRFVDGSIAGLRRIPAEARAMAGDMMAAGSQMVQSLWDGASAKFNEFIEWVRGLPGRIRAAFGNVNLRSALNFSSNGSMTGAEKAGAMVGGMVAPPPDGKRAAGGPVNRGLTYLVGERGPELFTASRSGNIVPNHKLGGAGGGAVFNNTFHLHGGATKEQAMEILRTLDRQLNRASQLAFDSGKSYGD